MRRGSPCLRGSVSPPRTNLTVGLRSFLRDLADLSTGNIKLISIRPTVADRRAHVFALLAYATTHATYAMTGDIVRGLLAGAFVGAAVLGYFRWLSGSATSGE